MRLIAEGRAERDADIALVEDTGSILLTVDANLAPIPGTRCRVGVAE